MRRVYRRCVRCAHGALRRGRRDRDAAAPGRDDKRAIGEKAYRKSDLEAIGAPVWHARDVVTASLAEHDRMAHDDVVALADAPREAVKYLPAEDRERLMLAHRERRRADRAPAPVEPGAV